MAGKQVLKDKKVTVYKYVDGTDAEGFPVKAYMPIHAQPTVWAYFKQLSGSLYFASAQTNVKEDCLFRLNYTKALKRAYADEYRVLYDGILYKVTRIDPYEGYTRDLAIYCTATTDKATDTIPYDPKKL